MSYEKFNAKNVLANVEKHIDWLEHPEKSEVEISGYIRLQDGSLVESPYHGKRHYFDMRDVCEDLSIFDWWNDKLSMSQLKDMRKFLREAIKLGYTGYACFKVGATGCANGMWVNKKESTNGYSPDGACIYKSFTPDYECWSVSPDGNRFFPNGDDWNSAKTIKQFEKIVAMVEA